MTIRSASFSRPPAGASGRSRGTGAGGIGSARSLRSAKNTALGQAGEAFAARLYTARGAVVLARNVRYANGELDLVVREPDGTYVFVEVKTRASADFGVAEAVTPRKLSRMRRAAVTWLSGQARLKDVRFDVVALTARPVGAPGTADFDVELYQGVEDGAQ